MANDGELRFSTKIDTKGFEEGIDELKKKSKQATDSFDEGLGGNEKSLISLKNVAKIAGTYISGSLFKDALTQGVQFNAQVEQYTSTFETFTGSVEKANDVVNQLIEMGASTPFDFLDLANATQKLMSFGLSADNAIGSLTMLGNASQGDSQKLDSIVTAFGRMSSSAKVTLEDLNMMIDSGFNPLTKVAENTGMTMAQVYEAISDGELPVQEVTKAMQQMTSEGGQYFGLMEKQSQTLNGKMSTLKDTWDNFLGDSVKPLSDFLRDSLIPTLIDTLSNFGNIYNVINKLKPALTTIKQVLIAVGTVIAGWKIGKTVQSIVTGFQTAKLAISLYTLETNGATVAQGLLNGVLTASEVVVGLLTGKITLAEIATALWTKAQMALNAVLSANPIALVIIAIAALIAIGYLLISNWETVSKVASDVWNYIVEAFSNVATWFNDNVVQPIAEAFTNIYNAIVEIINTIISAVVNFAISVWQAIYNNIIVPVTTIWSTWIQPVIDKIIEIISKLIEIIIALFLAFVNFINSSIIQPIISFFSNLFNSIVNIFTSLATWFNSSVVQPIISFFSDMFNSIGSFAQGCWNTITGAFSSVATFFGNIFSVAYKKVTEAFSGIASFFSGIWDTIKTTFTNLGTNIADAIGGAVKSGINGIISLIEGTINTAISLINGAIDIINYIPGVDIEKIDKLKMPRLEKGGILKKGQVGFLEGNGAEAVVPLDRNKYWIKAVAKEFDRNVPQTVTNNKEQVVNFYTPVSSPDEVSRKMRIDARLGLIG